MSLRLSSMSSISLSPEYNYLATNLTNSMLVIKYSENLLFFENIFRISKIIDPMVLILCSLTVSISLNLMIEQKSEMFPWNKVKVLGFRMF